METLRIGQVARRAGVSVQAVRFYEREGLLPRPARRPSGYRVYPESTVRRLAFIRRAKELGFSLKEIRELFALRMAPGSRCETVKQRVLLKIAQVDEKIAELRRLRAALVTLAASCSGEGPTSECPILDALEGQNLQPGKRPAPRRREGRPARAARPGRGGPEGMRAGTR